MLGHKNVSFRKVWDGLITVSPNLYFVCILSVPGLRIYLKFSYLTAVDFLTPSEFPHGGNTMTKIQMQSCLQRWGDLNHPSSLDVCRLALLAISPPQYVIIAANIVHPPTTLKGLASQPELLESKFSIFLNPIWFDKHSKKFTLNANWTTTSYIYYACVSSTLVLFVLSATVTLCIAFQGAMSFSPTGNINQISTKNFFGMQSDLQPHINFALKKAATMVN